MSTIYSLSDRLGELVYERPMPRLDYCAQFAQPINLNAYTAQERAWMEEEARRDQLARGGV